MAIALKSRSSRLVAAGIGVAVILVAAGAAAMLSIGGAPNDEIALWNQTNDVAISGYDTVSYFAKGEAIEGKEEFQQRWQDATWLFAEAGHRDLFASDPERYAPQFGGFCATGMTYGATAKADPEVWAIIDDKLYLNFDEYAHEIFHDNVETNVANAERKWAEQIEAERASRAAQARLTQ